MTYILERLISWNIKFDKEDREKRELYGNANEEEQ